MLSALHSHSLTLRPFVWEDMPQVLKLVQDKDVAATTLNIPYPCTEAEINDWFQLQQWELEEGKGLRWAVCLTKNKELVGAVKLATHPEYESAELGYWIGRPYWGKGYASKATRLVVEYGFNVLELNRIEAHAMVENAGSSRVLLKLGMQEEGYHPQLIKKWGEFKDVKTYGLLRNRWLATPSTSTINERLSH
ncbi:GNAT family N-acetyltransferase [Tunicatimonas pelagia]|uniref:GNAT family N-acetyltransferase n=1 Tax=Tunicatimonas pelagia TaxID=931531 RepID=UPI002666E672|nr:GNAT family N-acetyltransferase [Tunicatimonas pelagia]WKN40670.1 GNAT family N-acetyltransferase [Tunicatimonas pelagia]